MNLMKKRPKLNIDAKKLKKWIPLICKIFPFFNNILDPEMPESLTTLKIISLDCIYVKNCKSYPSLNLCFWIIPTTKNCSMSSLLGILIENVMYQKPFNRMLDCKVPKNWNWTFSVEIPVISHIKAFGYTKQLNDKERCSAAFENVAIRHMIDACYRKALKNKN